MEHGNSDEAWFNQSQSKIFPSAIRERESLQNLTILSTLIIWRDPTLLLIGLM